MKVEVHFLGQPEILIDHVRLTITQKKIEAMLLYILFNGTCTRDELVAIFWCDCDEEGARGNLRNSLYKIRNLIGKDFLLTGGRSYISLNPEVEIFRDTDLFIMENSEQRLLELNRFCFLDKYYLKNCPGFEEWVCSMQNTYERLLRERLLPAMRGSFKKGDHVMAEKYAEYILRFDIHNEEAVYTLIKICGQNGEYNKAVYAYTQYSERLYQDMHLEPGAGVKKEYEDVMRMKTELRRNTSKGPFYLGHIRALAALQEEYSKYRQGFPYDTCIICGEEGMDKEEVWWKFTKEYNARDVIKIHLKSTDVSVDYYAIRELIAQTAKWLKIQPDDLMAGSPGENADLYFMNLVGKLAWKAKSARNHCIMRIDNLEYADQKSLCLILGCLLEYLKSEIFIMAGFSLNFQMNFNQYARERDKAGLRLICLEPLKEGECSRYLKECFPDGRTFQQEEKEIYRYTAGNLLMLREVAANIVKGEENVYAMSPKAQCQFFSLLENFSREEQEYLEYLAVMENGVEVSVLCEMLQVKAVHAIRCLLRLLNSGILEEINQKGHERLRIKSKMLRDIIYSRTAAFKKNELHRMAQQYYESARAQGRIQYDLFVLSELKYHSAQAGRVDDALYYNVYYLRYILDYYDEFFPAVPHDVEYLQTFTVSRKEIYQTLDTFQNCYDMMEGDMDAGRCYELQMEIYYLKGRTLNRDGKREKGLIYAEKLIGLAGRAGDERMLLYGYIEALCYGVKAEDSALMKRYLCLVKEMKNLSYYQPEYGSILRLESYCHILDGEYETAEELLNKSIEIFSRPRLKNTYFYPAAGAYDYLAITYRCRGQYDKALEAIEEALRLCKTRGSRKGLDLFYEDYAYILFLQGRMEEAEKFFCISARIYDEFGTYWLRSIGESCMAMIHLEKKEEKEALEHFRRAEIFSKKEKTKEELEVLEIARGKLKKAKVLA